MKLDTNRWYVKLYFFSIWLIERVFSKGWYWKTEKQRRTNLCHFMRVVLVYMPLLVLWHIATAALVVYVAVIYPLTHFGLSAYGIVWLVVIASVAIVAGCFFVAAVGVGVCQWLEDWLKRPSNTSAHTGFSLFVEYLKAKKQRFCPTITFVKGDN